MTDPTSSAPNPGSREALARGCTCPVFDNRCGEGFPSTRGHEFWIAFWITANCPLHAMPAANRNQEPTP